MPSKLLKKITTPKVKTVAVLMGGWSREDAVSFVSGKACAKALRECGYDVREIEVTRDLKQFIEDLGDLPDVIFNALHGKGGEDGCIQGVLDMLGVRYTHSGRLASALAMDKSQSKTLVSKHGVQCPEGHIISIEDLSSDTIPLTPPYIIKPNREGSSVGIYIIREGDNRIPDIAQNWDFGEILIEQYIPGRELTVTVVSTNGNDAEALTVTEIMPHTQFYDYEAKYETGGSTHALPAQVPTDIFEIAQLWAIKAHQALGCSGVTRSDFRYDDTRPGTSGLFYLETNTQPGMTPTSLSPEQAEYTGLNFNDFVQWMVENAQCHDVQNKNQSAPRPHAGKRTRA